MKVNICLKRMDKNKLKKIRRKKFIEKLIGFIVKLQPLIITIINFIINRMYE